MRHWPLIHPVGYSVSTMRGVSPFLDQTSTLGPPGPIIFLKSGTRRLKTLFPFFLILLILIGSAPPHLAAQESGGKPIFRRFSRTREPVTSRMGLIEFPVLLRPQTYADAEVRENLGLGYVLAKSPKNQVFTAFGINWARMEFLPSNPEVVVIDIKQIDLSQSLNFWLWRTFVISLGAGIGIMDTFVILSEGTAEHQIVPYVPLQFGLIIPLRSRLSIGLRLVHTPFMGSGAASGNTRLLFGLGGSF